MLVIQKLNQYSQIANCHLPKCNFLPTNCSYSTKKGKAKQKYKEKKDINAAVSMVNAFNLNGSSITFIDMSPSKLKAILMSLDLSKRTVLHVNGTYYTLTLEKVKQMLRFVRKFMYAQRTHGEYTVNAVSAQ